MPSITPVRITVDQRALMALAGIFNAASPQEGCALLLGRGMATPSAHVQGIWPCLNSWPDPDQRRRRFALDPREQLLAQRWTRQRGLAVIGVAHSHPSSLPVPSQLDQELTLAPALLLIAAPATLAAAADPGCAAAVVACGWRWAFWWLDETRADGIPPAPASLPWTMAD